MTTDGDGAGGRAIGEGEGLVVLPVVPPARADPEPGLPDWGDALAVVLSDPAQPRLVFQPVVDVARGVVAGYEVLSRFSGPPTVAPDQWFAAAHEHGCAVELEVRVLRRVLLDLRCQVRRGASSPST